MLNRIVTRFAWGAAITGTVAISAALLFPLVLGVK